jgi:hypothetical protein
VTAKRLSSASTLLLVMSVRRPKRTTSNTPEFKISYAFVLPIPTLSQNSFTDMVSLSITHLRGSRIATARGLQGA